MPYFDIDVAVSNSGLPRSTMRYRCRATLLKNSKPSNRRKAPVRDETAIQGPSGE
jgi:hypothetical protein